MRLCWEQLGARMKVAQELLRHADIQTTMNVYTGVTEKYKREAANRVALPFSVRCND
jgi:integrase